MRIIKVEKCHECPYHEGEWNRKNQNYDMRCKKFNFHIVSGDVESLRNEPIPSKCNLEKR